MPVPKDLVVPSDPMKNNTYKNTIELGPIPDAAARSPLLLIDDNIENLNLLERMLDWAGYLNVHRSTSAEDGLAVLKKVDPFLIILDLGMPGMSGFDFLEQVRGEATDESYIPILVYTADISRDAKTKALTLGASDFLTKPGDAHEIQLRVRNFLRMRAMHVELRKQNDILESKVLQRTESLATARREAVDALARACEYRDDSTGQHCRRVGELSAGIAFGLGLNAEFVESIRIAAALHDVGKIAVPDSILRKPAKLLDHEMACMREHVRIGAEILGDVVSPVLMLAKEIARYHHERWDGTGYECGLVGEEIPHSARIVAAADAFDAMTHDRPYHRALNESQALQVIRAACGTHFDPTVAPALEAHLRRVAAGASTGILSPRLTTTAEMEAVDVVSPKAAPGQSKAA